MSTTELIDQKKKKAPEPGLPPAGSIPVRIAVTRLLADTCTPVSLYLRLRDKYPGAVLLESADNAEGRNSRSFIGIQAVASVTGQNKKIRIAVPSCMPDLEFPAEKNIAETLEQFRRLFDLKGDIPKNTVTGLIGYTAFDTVRYFEDVKTRDDEYNDEIPFLRYTLYRTLIVFDHLHHTLSLVEQLLPGDVSDNAALVRLIGSRDVPQFRFSLSETETKSETDEEFLSMVRGGISHCRRGDVFQLVLSRRFSRRFSGDEFNVYRALRTINPSPYLFFADFGDYRIFGSSPEAQLIVHNDLAELHPIAGTFRRTGDENRDRILEEELVADPKENAEHIMLVDLARNDLSRSAAEVHVSAFREVHRYSHVIHLVSKVNGKLKPGTNRFSLLAGTFPAGTLSGAPKVRAMELIAELEKTPRGYYGGCIGIAGFDGSMNQAIMIRSFLSKNNELVYRAGAGIVVNSSPENELKEIDNKLEALRSAMLKAETISN